MDGEAPGRSTGPPEIVELQSLAAGGEAVGRMADGRVVFVEGGAPGDRVELADVELRKRFARARIGRLVEAGPDRVRPRCPHFGICGGCQWQHLDYGAQLAAKRRTIEDALTRLAGVPPPADFEVKASPAEYGYRARARLLQRLGRFGYRKRGSHAFLPVEACPVLLPAAEGRIASAAGTAAGARTGMESDEAAGAAVDEWTLSCDGGRETALVPVAARSGPEAEGAVQIELRGERLRVSSDAFLQANALLWDELVETVLEAAGVAQDVGTRAEPHRFVELYAGVGFFSLPLLRSGAEGAVFESDRAALSDLRENLARAGLGDRVEVIGGRVERRRDWPARLRGVELLLVDPPRIGLAPAVRAAIADAGPGRVVYVSCDPATFARDLRALAAAGYRLDSLVGLDLFPQTAHVELVARLEREAR